MYRNVQTGLIGPLYSGDHLISLGCSMIFLRLAGDYGIVEIPAAETARLEGDDLVLRSADGQIVARFPKLSVLAYSHKREQLAEDAEEDTAG